MDEFKDINNLVKDTLEQTNATSVDAEPTAVASTPTEAEESFGKFKTKEQLISAYNSLEAEFTRRSQRIKELEATVNKHSVVEKWEQRVDELAKKYPIAKTMSDELMGYLKEHKELMQAENCLETALLHTLANKHMSGSKVAVAKTSTDSGDAVKISQLQKNAIDAVPLISTNMGETPLVKPIIPQSIGEAGSLAIQILGKNKK